MYSVNSLFPDVIYVSVTGYKFLKRTYMEVCIEVNIL